MLPVKSALVVAESMLENSASFPSKAVVVSIEVSSVVPNVDIVFRLLEELKMLEELSVVLSRITGSLIVVVDPQANDMIDAVLGVWYWLGVSDDEES